MKPQIHAAASEDANAMRDAFLVFDRAARQLAGGCTDLQVEVERLMQDLATAASSLQQEVAARQSAVELLTAVLAVLPMGIIVIDPDSQIIEANPAAERMLGARLPGKCWRTVAAARLRSAGRDKEWTVTGGTATLRLHCNALSGGGGRSVMLEEITTGAAAHAVQ